MRRTALAILAALAIAGCSSTVLLGTLAVDGGGPASTDLARPGFDGFDGGDFGHGDGFDLGPIFDFGSDFATDGGAPPDLA